MIKYEIAAALRGPDESSLAASQWKWQVTCVIRHFTMRVYKTDPLWCRGVVIKPSLTYEQSPAEASDSLKLAQEFSCSDKSEHVKFHAYTALKALIELADDPELRSEIKTHYNWAFDRGLLGGSYGKVF